MLVKIVDTVVSTDSVGRPVDAIPIREWAPGETSVTGVPLAAVPLEVSPLGAPARYVVGKTAVNSAGQVVDSIPTTGGGGVSAAMKAKAAKIIAAYNSYAPRTVMSSPPTITVGAGFAASTIGSSGTVNSPDYVLTNALIRKSGPIRPQGANVFNGYYGNWSWNAGQLLDGGMGWRAAYFITNSASIEFATTLGNSLSIRLRIDGQWSSLSDHVLGSADYNPHLVKIAFGSTASRIIEIFVGNLAQPIGINVIPGSTFTAVPADLAEVIGWYFGDSFVQGTYTISGIKKTLPHILSDRMMIPDMVPFGRGAQGFTTAVDSLTINQRMAQDADNITTPAPDLIISAGSVNDRPNSASLAQANITLGMDAIKAAQPDAWKVFFTGFKSTSNPTDAAHFAAYAAGAMVSTDPYLLVIDTSDMPTIATTGTLPNGQSNDSPDGNHPGDNWNAYVAPIVADRIIAALKARTGVAGVAALRTQPDTADRFYVVVTCTDGLIRKFRFQRNTGAATDAQNLGVAWPEWRLTGMGYQAAFADDPSSAGTWVHNDVGAAEGIVNVSGKSFGSYHGVGSGGINSEALTIDGVAFDPTVVNTGNVLVVRNDVTATDGTSSFRRDFSLTVDNSGDATYTAHSVVTTGTITYARIGMPIAAGDDFSEAQIGYGGSLTPMMLGTGEFTSRLYDGISHIRARNPLTGDWVEARGTGLGVTGYAYSELFKQLSLSRTKGYLARFTSNYSNIGGLSWTLAVGKSSPGALTPPTNLLTNGDFAANITGWALALGSTAPAWQSPGYLRLTREAGGDNRIRHNAAVPTVIGDYVLLSGDLVALSGGSGPLIRGSTLNSLGGTPIFTQTMLSGKNVIVFKATTTTTYVGPGLSLGTAGQTADTDNFACYQLTP